MAPNRAATRHDHDRPLARDTKGMRVFPAATVLLLVSCGPAETPSAPGARPDALAMQARVEALAPPYNGADYEAGRAAFAQCRACHLVDARVGNRVGPNLSGLFGREIGALEGFAYSRALQDADMVWTPEHLDRWLENPQTFLPGNRMAFAGVADADERRDLIAYLLVETEPE